METKITGLTASNIDALKTTSKELVDVGALELTRTTATFRDEPQAVLRYIDVTMAGLPTRGHPRASLHAVRRKIAALI
jgi:hypothetical protein